MLYAAIVHCQHTIAFMYIVYIFFCYYFFNDIIPWNFIKGVFYRNSGYFGDPLLILTSQRCWDNVLGHKMSPYGMKLLKKKAHILKCVVHSLQY